jgi:hypothetical protein
MFDLLKEKKLVSQNPTSDQTVIKGQAGIKTFPDKQKLRKSVTLHPSKNVQGSPEEWNKGC